MSTDKAMTPGEAEMGRLGLGVKVCFLAKAAEKLRYASEDTIDNSLSFWMRVCDKKISLQFILNTT